jgi:hypothetical protein
VVELIRDKITFSPWRGLPFPRRLTKRIEFPSNVRQVAAFLTGFRFGYSHREDHRLGLVDIGVNAFINDNAVRVRVALGVRDWSGDVDDDYEGEVSFALVVELYPEFNPDDVWRPPEGLEPR